MGGGGGVGAEEDGACLVSPMNVSRPEVLDA